MDHLRLYEWGSGCIFPRTLLRLYEWIAVQDMRPVLRRARIDDEVADARIKNECCDSDCFKEKSRIETKFTKSTKSSAPLRMGVATINAVNSIVAVISVVLSLVFI